MAKRLDATDGRENGNGGSKNAVTDNHGSAGDGDEEKEEASRMTLLEHVLDVESTSQLVGRSFEFVVGELGVFGLVIGNQADLCIATDQGVESKGTAIAVVVGEQDDEDVLEHGNEGNGVDDEGKHPKNVILMINSSFGESGREHVQRRRPYVPIHDSDALKC